MILKFFDNGHLDWCWVWCTKFTTTIFKFKKKLIDCFKAGPFYIRPFVCFSTVKTTSKPVNEAHFEILGVELGVHTRPKE